MNLSEVPEGVPCEVELKRYAGEGYHYIRYHKDGIVYDAEPDFYGRKRGTLVDGYVVVKKLFREDGDD